MFKPKALVTGGAGFIGSHMVDALVNLGFKVFVIDNLSTGTRDNLNPAAEFFETDVRGDELQAIFKDVRPEIVCHFAAQININNSVDDPVYDAEVNIIGGLNVLENCLAAKVKKILFSSTGGALYGEAEKVPTAEDYPCEPVSPYGIAKLAMENYLRFYREQFGLQTAIMRYANVYGPRQNPQGEAGVISIFASKLLKGQTPIIHGDGHQTRDYVFVEDVVRANLAALAHKGSFIGNVATGRQTTVNEIYSLIAKELDSNIKPRHEDIFSGQKVSCLAIEKIKQELDWAPEVTLTEGIKKTVEWFESSL